MIHSASSKGSSIPCTPIRTTSVWPTCRTRTGDAAALRQRISFQLPRAPRKPSVRCCRELKGRLDGIAARVPVPDGSVVDLFVELEKSVNPDDVHTAIKSAAASERMKGILQLMETPVVSSDVIGNSHSSIFDPAFTSVTGANI